jgi:DDE superfamily endonuclease
VKPQRSDAADYSGRKHAFSLSALIICDDQKLIRFYVAGYPGTWHDNRIYRASDLYGAPTRYFSPLEYLLTDSAFEPSPTIIPAYRKPPGGELHRDKKVLNTAIGRPRVQSEHCLGMQKGRFPWLRSIPCAFKEGVTSAEKINLYMRCCFILHNLLVQHKDHIDDPMWDVDLSEFDDIDDPGGLRGTDEEIGLHYLADATGINRPVPVGSHPGLRREQHCSYLRDSYLQGGYSGED